MAAAASRLTAASYDEHAFGVGQMATPNPLEFL
jgi:hypothetical protein